MMKRRKIYREIEKMKMRKMRLNDEAKGIIVITTTLAYLTYHIIKSDVFVSLGKPH